MSCGPEDCLSHPHIAVRTKPALFAGSLDKRIDERQALAARFMVHGTACPGAYCMRSARQPGQVRVFGDQPSRATDKLLAALDRDNGGVGLEPEARRVLADGVLHVALLQVAVVLFDLPRVAMA